MEILWDEDENIEFDTPNYILRKHIFENSHNYYTYNKLNNLNVYKSINQPNFNLKKKLIDKSFIESDILWVNSLLRQSCGDLFDLSQSGKKPPRYDAFMKEFGKLNNKQISSNSQMSEEYDDFFFIFDELYKKDKLFQFIFYFLHMPNRITFAEFLDKYRMPAAVNFIHLLKFLRNNSKFKPKLISRFKLKIQNKRK
jgi:hypothetical protein